MTDYVILNDASARHRALMTSKQAIDIQYKCPKCGIKRMVTWLFPDTDMIYEDECHGELVHFKPMEENK